MQLEAPEGVELARLKCEVFALQAAADGPVPLDLVCEGTIKPAGVRRREAALEEAVQAAVDGAPELEDIHSPSFLAVIVALGHHEVRCCVVASLPSAMQQQQAMQHTHVVYETVQRIL